MKILFLVRSLGRGGAERQVVELAKGLRRAGHDPAVATFYAGGPFERELREAGVRTIAVPKRGRWDLVFFLFRLVRLLRRERPDMLHGYLPVPNLLAALCRPFLAGTRIVWGVRASNVDQRRYGMLFGLVFRIECLLSPLADLIIVNSHAGREHYRKHGVPADKMIIIPNGIDTERFRPDRSVGERVREAWKVKRGEKLIGLVGRLDPMKGHSVFLRAAALLLRERNDVRFVCIGDGPAEYGSQLRALARELGLTGRVIWENGRPDMEAVYNALDIVTSASRFGEGFPNVIGEAMACGVPCVVTDVGDSARIVGDLGIVVRHSDPDALKDGWSRCLRQERGDRSVMLRRRIEENFSTDALVRNTLVALDPDERIHGPETSSVPI